MAKRATAIRTRPATKRVEPANMNTRYTTQVYYGLVTITNHDEDTTARIGTMVTQMLADIGIPATVAALWVHHHDGVDTIESRWVGGKWVKADA
jgi:hypothetical protein